MRSGLKKILLLVLFFQSASICFSQSPASYVRDWVPVKPVTNTEDLLLQTTTNSLASLKTGYADGLARPYQSVVKTGSLESGGSAVDAVSFHAYDVYGREVKQYLPFAANSGGGNTSISDGRLKTAPATQQTTFLNAVYSAQSESGNYYTETIFETSGLARPLKTMAPGASWVGSSRGVETKYWLNTLDDEVRKWDVTDNTNAFGDYTSSGIYGAGQLTKTITVDEHGKHSVEFRDKSGRIILKKKYLTTSNIDEGDGVDHGGYLCTYYIYDKLGNLRCVVQPEGVNALFFNSWTMTSTILDEQCFRYEYDARGRMITKKVPGAGKVDMVYDARDRLVLSNDGNSPYTWKVTVYDALNRPIQTGLIAMEGTPQYFRAEAWDEVEYPGTLYGDIQKLTETHYDDYDDLPSGLSASMITTWNSEFASTNLTTHPFPEMPVQSNLINGKVAWTSVRVLGSDPEVWIHSVMIYDENGRVIQVQTKNGTGGVDVATTQYNWKGQMLMTVQKHRREGRGEQTVVSVTKLTYDELFRLIKTERKVSSTLVNSGTMPSYKTIAELSYDKQGQLKEKKLAPGYNSNAGLETLTYDYNVRGWMLGSNREYAKGGEDDHYFGFDLGYDKTSLFMSESYAAAQYTGNICGTVWRSKGDNEMRRYDFTYDNTNRLMAADFLQAVDREFVNSSGVDFTMTMGNGWNPSTAYDANGNILTMKQYGLKLGGSEVVDEMKYTYNTGSNKLKSVTDFYSDPDTKLGDFKTSNNHPQQSAKAALTSSSSPGSFNAITDYTYDDNGNLKLDNNKDISDIVYNHLNLPEVITVTGKGTITYTYDATGNKLKKVTVDNTVSPSKETITEYMGGGFVYVDDGWQYMPQEEGRIRYKPAVGAVDASLEYDYMLKDHLGNVRMVLTEETKSDIYQATIEDATRTAEEALFTNIPSTESAKPTADAGFDSDAGNQKVSKLFGNSNADQRVGPGIVLKVMAGDKFTADVNAWYTAPDLGGSLPPATDPIINMILNSFTGGLPTGAHHTGVEIGNSGSAELPLGDFLDYQNNAYDNSRPQAFLNWMILDEEQLKLVDGNYGAIQVPAINSTTTQKQLMQANSGSEIEVKKNGYLYVYVSNESDQPVYFDDLRVEHTRGPIIEETHYYPFGLPMAGISSKGLNEVLENPFKYNGIEQNKDLGLNVYDAFFRQADPQIGRWWQTDPKPTLSVSMFAMMENNPVRYADFLGDTTYMFNKAGKFKGAIYDGLKSNEIVVLADIAIKSALSIQKAGSLSNDELAEIVRGSKFAYARITKNTIDALTKQWRGMDGVESTGYLYINDKTREVQVYSCKDCGLTAGSASMRQLGEHYDEVSSLGKILGVWHSHPANSFAGSQPSSTYESKLADFINPLFAMNNANEGLGIIVTQSTATIYPLTGSMPASSGYTEDPNVTVPKYTKDFTDFRTSFQFGVFNSNISPQTIWKR